LANLGFLRIKNRSVSSRSKSVPTRVLVPVSSSSTTRRPGSVRGMWLSGGIMYTVTVAVLETSPSLSVAVKVNESSPKTSTSER